MAYMGGGLPPAYGPYGYAPFGLYGPYNSPAPYGSPAPFNSPALPQMFGAHDRRCSSRDTSHHNRGQGRRGSSRGNRGGYHRDTSGFEDRGRSGTRGHNSIVAPRDVSNRGAQRGPQNVATSSTGGPSIASEVRARFQEARRARQRTQQTQGRAENDVDVVMEGTADVDVKALRNEMEGLRQQCAQMQTRLATGEAMMQQVLQAQQQVIRAQQLQPPQYRVNQQGMLALTQHAGGQQVGAAPP
ncbi:hypothetical protein BDV95DRAFT_605276 [Massariosphaeria phaeospora]|uniref:Uncharacterized protein n=1 Tax=Massariosphaeria phaeospora TaxID=100035 RepID=A0A7C8MCU7_9PLEO|nr:hypothetical protein BDV95DRAFT_605276 [Massariosphaeria phaeospora]